MLSFYFLVLFFTGAFGFGLGDRKNSSTQKLNQVKTLKEEIDFFHKISKMRENRVDLVIKFDGYPVESHNVTTEDGYILNLLRIPWGKPKSQRRRRPVLIICGYYDPTSICFTLDKDSLPYVLADAGFDVWVGTFRGFPLSSGHVNYTQADPNYWDYSQDEIGFYDIPAFIDYILRVTGRSKLYYIGYSYGTMVGYIALADRPDYLKKVWKLVNVAPTIVTANNKLLSFLLPAFFAGVLGDARLGKPRKIVDIFPLTRPCNKKPDPKHLTCSTLMGNLFGSITGPLYEDRMGYRLLTMVRNVVSMKMLLHFYQQLRTRRFAHYDYGSEANRKRYGSKRAPLYNISRVTVPAMTIYSDGDAYSPPEDARTFIDSLSAAGRGPVIRIKDVNFSHLDFAFRREARGLVYDPIVKYFLDSEKL